jgi:hypothetical protein
MPEEDLPTYLRGDTISFRVELEHGFNLGDAGAVFYRLGEQEEGADPFPLELSASEIDEMSRDGTTIVSSVIFEVEINRENHIPGEYELGTIVGLRAGYGRRPERGGEDLGRPEQRVAFRIAEDPTELTAKVVGWELSRQHNYQRFTS